MLGKKHFSTGNRTYGTQHCKIWYASGKQPAKQINSATHQSFGWRRAGLSITLYGTVTVVGVAPGAAWAWCISFLR